MSKQLFDTFPYEFRENQEEILEEISDCLERGVSLIYQASTGSGKTICTLAPVVHFAEINDKRVLYLTRTNSQQRQVIYELRQLGDHYGLGLQGRKNTCLLALNDEELMEGTAEELSKYCSDRKKEVREAIAEDKDNFSCPFYAGLLQCDLDEVREYTKEELPTVDEFLEYCEDDNLCAYELTKALIPDATLITAPYIYFFLPFIRRRLLEWMDVEMDDLIVVVDEAHNLPDYARELASSELTTITLERAVGESEEFGDPSLKDDVSITSLFRLFKNILLDIVDEFVGEEDGLIPPNHLRTELMHSLGLNTNDLKSIIKDLKLQGEIVQQKKREEKKLPRSYIHSIAEFLSFWLSMNKAEYIKLVNGGDNPSLEGFCLDPSRITEALNHCYCSVHQSATLEPVDEYRDSIGLPYDTVSKIYPSPFPKENKVIYYREEVTTRYEVLQRDDKMIDRLREELEEIMTRVDRNMVIFFPSYRLMDQVALPLIEGKKDAYIEGQGMTQPDLMEMVNNFKRTGGILLSVIGGRISEGMDFPGSELEVAVVVGIPYPKPTARQRGLQHYYDMKFNKGWEYTVKAPAVRKILQSTGRLLRSETDLGAAVILDERTVHFKEYLPRLRLTDDPSADIVEFFEGREKKDR